MEISPKALILMTVQPKADPPQAETGADRMSDTDRLKTGARVLNDQSLTSCSNRGRKENSSPRESLCLLDLPANG